MVYMPIVMAYICHYCFYSVADGIVTLFFMKYLVGWLTDVVVNVADGKPLE